MNTNRISTYRSQVSKGWGKDKVLLGSISNVALQKKDQ